MGTTRAAAGDGASALRWAAGALSSRTRLLVVLGGVACVSGRVLGLLGAARLLEGDARGAAIVAGLTAAAYGARRVATTAARVATESDVHVATTRALLAADVLEPLPVEPRAALARGIEITAETHAAHVPGALADVLAIAFAAVLLGRVLEPGTIGVGVVAAAGATLGALAVRGRVARLYEAVARARETLGEATAAALDGRLEIVASASEPDAVRRVAGATADYARAAHRAAAGAALLGRAPLVIAAVVCGIMLYRGVGSDADVIGALARAAVVYGAALAPVFGAFAGALAVVRGVASLGPFASVVVREARRERTNGGAITTLPAPVRFVCVDFGYRAGAPVLRGFDLTWPEGLLVLRGPNGAGKSTVLRLLLGLRAPDRGRVEIGGRDLADVDLRDLRARCTYLPQRPYLGEPFATVDSVGVAPAALARVGLAAAGARTLGELSAGQRQRLALARILDGGASLVLLDEPDANLDREGVALLVTIVRELVARGAMVAVAAHGDELLAIEGARVVELLSPSSPS